MISHEHKFIFIHIPKCAGTSVESYFGHLTDNTGRGGQDHRPIRLLQTPIPYLQAFSTAENRFCLARRLYHACRLHSNPRNRRTLTAAQYECYFKFAIIRDPWSRVYSWYRNVMRDPLHLKKYGIERSMDFYTFLDRFGGRGMLAPIDFWLKEFDGNVRLDALIKIGSLATEFPEICENFGVKNAYLPLKNQAEENVSLEEVYDVEGRKKIEEIYCAEIRRYGFSFPE